MVELQNGASKSTTPKEKTSLLDEDIGKEYLGSWKSMSVTEDDAMDFNFETMPKLKDKKNKFNFDKLDMDFNIDGEFEKMASFKVDMADLDFSSPQKKNSKPKEKSEEESSSGKSQGKQNRFAFSFDFNELDDFNFDSSLTEGNRKSKFSESQKHTAGINNSQISNADDMEASELPSSGHATSSKDYNLVSVPDHSDTSRDSPPAKTSRDNPPAKSSIFGNIGVLHGVRNTLERTTIVREEETHHQSQKLEKTVSSVPSGQPTITNEVQAEVGLPNSKFFFTLETVTKEVQAEVGLPNSRFKKDSGGEQNAGTKIISDSVSNYESIKMNNASTLPMEEPQSIKSEKSKLVFNSHVPSKSTSDSEPPQVDMVSEDTSATRSPRRMLCDATTSRENQMTSKVPVVTLSRDNNEAMVGKLTTRKEQDTGVTWSRFFKKSEDTECQLLQALSSKASNLLSEKKITCTVRSSLVNKNREISNDNASKMVGDSSAQAGESTAEETLFLGSGNNSSNSNKTSCQVNPSSIVMEPTNKSNMQKSVNPKLGAPTMASLSKIVSVERKKNSSLKAARTPDLCTLNISGSIAAKKAISNSTLQKECKSMKTSELNMKIHESTASKITHTTVSEKRTSVIPLLKRKTCELSNKDLVENPLKRLSPSVSESRYRGIEVSERVIQEQLCNHENQVNSKINIKNSFCEPFTTTIDFPSEVHMTDLEIPLVMESDGNVEKAEAYTKELEDICNMLKKKHEEAKELLVRAVVSNNNLLMLNHPIYDEKIRTVQEVAARLTQKASQLRSPTATCRG